MPASLDPAALAPDDRFRELARLLATALLRLKPPNISAEPPPSSSLETPRETSANQLAVCGEKSVTVHAG
jgi:hypothetical protein